MAKVLIKDEKSLELLKSAVKKHREAKDKTLLSKAKKIAKNLGIKL